MSLKWMQRKNTGFGERRNKIQMARRMRRRRKIGRSREREMEGKRRRRMMEFVWRLARRIWAGLHDDYLSNLQKRG